MPPGFKRTAVGAMRRFLGFLAHLFLEQLQVVQHPSKRKAVLTPRRAGKTELACVWLLNEASKNPGKKFLYVALTRPNAKDIAWAMFKRLDKLFSIGCHFQKSELQITLPNEAVIMLRGADQDLWIERLEGQEFLLIIIDESGLYNISVRKLVYDSLSPMVDSCDGTICLIGRPGLIKGGLFWDLTRPDLRLGDKEDDGSWSVTDEQGGKVWAVFNWHTFANPHVEKYWRAQIEEKLRINPKLATDPGFLRNYMGEWAEDVEGLVYAFEESRNVIDSYIPPQGSEFVMTTDFGWDDAQAFTISSWHPSRPELFILESYKQKNMPLSDALKRMEKYQERYPNLKMYGDPARKQLYMEMAIRFGEGSVVNPVEKEEKHDHIELMNHDYMLGKILIVRDTNQQFITEIKALRKLIKTFIIDAALNEERPGKWIEHPRLANDLCDTSLYGWRKARHFRYKEKPEGPRPGTPEYADAMAKKMWSQERDARQQKREWWKRL